MAFEGFRRLRNLAAVAGLTVPLAGDPGQTLVSPVAPGAESPQACDMVTEPNIAPPAITFVASKGRLADSIRKQIEETHPDIYKMPEPNGSAGDAVPDMSPPAGVETPEMPDTILPTKRIDA